MTCWNQLLNHVKLDLYLEKSHLTVQLHLLNKATKNYYLCMRNDSCEIEKVS
jgi:hypothetical protein